MDSTPHSLLPRPVLLEKPLPRGGIRENFALKELKLVMYPNRRAYSRQLHRYIDNMAEIGKYFDRGIRVTVIDSQTLADLTTEIIIKLLADRVSNGELKVTYEQLQKLATI